MHTSAAHPIAQAHRNPHGNLLSAHGTRHHAHPFLTLDVLSAAISMRRRGPAAGMPQPTYVGGPSLCQQKAQTGPGSWKVFCVYVYIVLYACKYECKYVCYTKHVWVNINQNQRLNYTGLDSFTQDACAVRQPSARPKPSLK